jgi:DNA excision repair protein ERCC-2
MAGHNKNISLTVRDLITRIPGTGRYLPGFPFHQRGLWGRRAQTLIHETRPEWRQEYPVSAEFRLGAYHFTVTGKIDLLCDTGSETVIEEVKTVIFTRTDFKMISLASFPHFCEQVRMYCYLYQLANPGQQVRPVLTFVNLLNDQRRSEDLSYDSDMIRDLILARLRLKVNEHTARNHVARKRATLARKITYRPSVSRPYQEEIIGAAAQTLDQGKNLLISAPTGSGKTVASLYPAIKYALRNNKKIFFATAKNTQQKPVDENLKLLLPDDFPLTVIFLRSREKMCANDIYFCHGDYCPYAVDFYRRIGESRITRKLTGAGAIYPDDVYAISVREQLCPAETQFMLSRQVDLVVGDYNYVYDPVSAPQSTFFGSLPGDWIVIIDEAHNLPSRILQLLSPGITRQEVDQLYRYCRSKKARIYRKIEKSLKNIRDLLQRLYRDAVVHAPDTQVMLIDPVYSEWEGLYKGFEQAYLHYLLHRIRYRQISGDDPIEKFYYQFHSFIRILESADERFTPYLSAQSGGLLKILCCDSSHYLQEQNAGFHSVIAMSATLDPMTYYASILGFRTDNTDFVRMAYPFHTARRRILLIPDFDTRLRQRYQNYPEYAKIIKNIVSLKRGNYVVFFPSFEFLQATNLFLGNLESERILQRSRMNDSDREEIIQSMRETAPPKVLLAVTGGIFAEGIDLYGEACIGIIVFGPSLPAETPEREIIRAYFDRKTGDGFSHAYIYPGMNRVIQAAGRLIRSEQDFGILVLVGDRLTEEQYAGLFPEYWGDLTITSDYQTPLREFWKNIRK